MSSIDNDYHATITEQQDEIKKLAKKENKLCSDNLFYKTRNLNSLQESYNNLQTTLEEKEQIINELQSQITRYNEINRLRETNEQPTDREELINEITRLKTIIDQPTDREELINEITRLKAIIDQPVKNNNTRLNYFIPSDDDDDTIGDEITGGKINKDDIIKKLQDENIKLKQKIAEQEESIKDYEQDLDVMSSNRGGESYNWLSRHLA